MDALGAHEIIVEDPGNRQFRRTAVARMEQVIHAWKLRMLDLSRDVRLRAFFIIKKWPARRREVFALAQSNPCHGDRANPRCVRSFGVAREFYERKEAIHFRGYSWRRGARRLTSCVREQRLCRVLPVCVALRPFEQAFTPRGSAPIFTESAPRRFPARRRLEDLFEETEQGAGSSGLQPLALHRSGPVRAPVITGTQSSGISAGMLKSSRRLNFSGGLELGTGCDLQQRVPRAQRSNLRKTSFVIYWRHVRASVFYGGRVQGVGFRLSRSNRSPRALILVGVGGATSMTSVLNFQAAGEEAEVRRLSHSHL